MAAELESLAAVADRLENGSTVMMCGHGERAGHRELDVLVGAPDDWASGTGRSLTVGP